MKRVLVGLSLLAIIGCQSAVGPVFDISGTWSGYGPEHSLTLNLVQQGTSVRGTGSSWAFIYPPTHEYTLTGTYSIPHVTITLTRDDSLVSLLTGMLLDSGHMITVRHIGTFSDTLRLTRQ